ncbi:MAG: DUF4276 family protein [Sedimentisphaerales bacterium]|nr:DUF4276 family protein [Sedimentisphaerales bacterium]
MSRVLALVEGQTERAVIQQTIAPYLSAKGVHLHPKIVGKPGHKGGVRSFSSVSNEIKNLLLQEPNSTVTTFFDYYALPSDWPGLARAKKVAEVANKPCLIEQAMIASIGDICNERIRLDMFLPYIQMHELESLLFSSPKLMSRVFEKPDLEVQFQKIVDECNGCEAINDGSETHPSSRIIQLFPRYKKGRSVNAHAPLIIEQIGIDIVRRQCPHFDDWLNRLEATRL